MFVCLRFWGGGRLLLVAIRTKRACDGASPAGPGAALGIPGRPRCLCGSPGGSRVPSLSHKTSPAPPLQEDSPVAALRPPPPATCSFAVSQTFDSKPLRKTHKEYSLCRKAHQQPTPQPYTPSPIPCAHCHVPRGAALAAHAEMPRPPSAPRVWRVPGGAPAPKSLETPGA